MTVNQEHWKDCKNTKFKKDLAGEEHLASQHRTDVINQYMLNDILRRRSEHLWVNSSKCSEDDLSNN